MQERLAGDAAPDLELRNRRVLEAFHDDQVACRKAGELRVERRLRRAAQLMHQHPAARRGHQHFGGAGVAVPVGVLARLVDVEAVVRVLDERDAQPRTGEARDQLLDERRFAAARPAGEAEHFHTKIIFAPAAASTTARMRRTSGFAKRRLPYSAPSQPPMSTATANTATCGGSFAACTVKPPARPAIELTKMNGAATAEVCLVAAQPIIRRSGERKMPPPTPVRPERKPNTAPTSIAKTIGGSCTVRTSSPRRALSQSCHAA